MASASERAVAKAGDFRAASQHCVATGNGVTKAAQALSVIDVAGASAVPATTTNAVQTSAP